MIDLQTLVFYSREMPNLFLSWVGCAHLSQIVPIVRIRRRYVEPTSEGRCSSPPLWHYTNALVFVDISWWKSRAFRTHTPDLKVDTYFYVQ